MFSNRLKYLRKKKGLTQQDMANFLGITRQGYGKYETGESETDNKTLVKLANFFDVTTDYLLGKSSDSKLNEQEDKESKEMAERFNELPEEKKELIKNLMKQLSD